jgi:hypothetical protein
MPLRRKFTLAEAVRIVQLAAAVERDDPPMADILRRLARGDDTAIADFHDRANILGRPEIADDVRRLMTGK